MRPPNDQTLKQLLLSKYYHEVYSNNQEMVKECNAPAD